MKKNYRDGMFKYEFSETRGNGEFRNQMVRVLNCQSIFSGLDTNSEVFKRNFFYFLEKKLMKEFTVIEAISSPDGGDICDWIISHVTEYGNKTTRGSRKIGNKNDVIQFIRGTRQNELDRIFSVKISLKDGFTVKPEE